MISLSLLATKKDADKDKNRKEIQDQEFFTSAQYKVYIVYCRSFKTHNCGCI